MYYFTSIVHVYCYVVFRIKENVCIFFIFKLHRTFCIIHFCHIGFRGFPDTKGHFQCGLQRDLHVQSATPHVRSNEPAIFAHLYLQEQKFYICYFVYNRVAFCGFIKPNRFSVWIRLGWVYKS